MGGKAKRVHLSLRPSATGGEAQSSQADSELETSKRRKISHPLASGESTVSAKPSEANGKQRASERTTIIEVPRRNSDIEDELHHKDPGITKQSGAEASSLQTLDEKENSKSKQELDHLHRSDRPTPTVPVDDDLPSVNSDTNDKEDGSSDVSEDLSEVDSSCKTLPVDTKVLTVID